MFDLVGKKHRRSITCLNQHNSPQVSKKYVSKELAKEIHAKAAPFVKWLKEAEEESEGSDDEEEEEEDENVEVSVDPDSSSDLVLMHSCSSALMKRNVVARCI